jgi:hypothetical protein
MPRIDNLDIDTLDRTFSNPDTKPKLFSPNDEDKRGLPIAQAGRGPCNHLSWSDDNSEYYFAIGVRFTGRLDGGGVFARIEAYDKTTELLVRSGDWKPVTENLSSASNSGVICVNMVTELANKVMKQVDQRGIRNS